jgi:DNA-binding transcriptional ArsR family regulator
MRRSEALALERAVDILSCLAHPVRLSVVARLERDGAATVSTLCAELDVEQSAMSHHLRHLRDAQLVIAEREGRAMRYALADAHVGHIVRDTLAHASEG